MTAPTGPIFLEDGSESDPDPEDIDKKETFEGSHLVWLSDYCVRIEDHKTVVMDEMIHLWQFGTLCDITLEAEGNKFQAHRVILCANSPYFSKSLMKVAPGDKVTLHMDNISADALTRILTYMYTGTVAITKKSCRDVYKAAGKLGCWYLQRLCVRFFDWMMVDIASAEKNALLAKKSSAKSSPARNPSLFSSTITKTTTYATTTTKSSTYSSSTSTISSKPTLLSSTTVKPSTLSSATLKSSVAPSSVIKPLSSVIKPSIVLSTVNKAPETSTIDAPPKHIIRLQAKPLSVDNANVGTTSGNTMGGQQRRVIRVPALRTMGQNAEMPASEASDKPKAGPQVIKLMLNPNKGTGSNSLIKVPPEAKLNATSLVNFLNQSLGKAMAGANQASIIPAASNIQKVDTSGTLKEISNESTEVDRHLSGVLEARQTAPRLVTVQQMVDAQKGRPVPKALLKNVAIMNSSAGNVEQLGQNVLNQVLEARSQAPLKPADDSNLVEVKKEIDKDGEEEGSKARAIAKQEAQKPKTIFLAQISKEAVMPFLMTDKVEFSGSSTRVYHYCLFCHTRFSAPAICYSHVQKTHGTDLHATVRALGMFQRSVVQVAGKNDPKSQMVVCTLCGSPFIDPETFCNHAKEQHLNEICLAAEKLKSTAGSQLGVLKSTVQLNPANGSSTTANSSFLKQATLSEENETAKESCNVSPSEIKTEPEDPEEQITQNKPAPSEVWTETLDHEMQMSGQSKKQASKKEFKSILLRLADLEKNSRPAAFGRDSPPDTSNDAIQSITRYREAADKDAAEKLEPMSEFLRVLDEKFVKLKDEYVFESWGIPADIEAGETDPTYVMKIRVLVPPKRLAANFPPNYHSPFRYECLFCSYKFRMKDDIFQHLIKRHHFHRKLCPDKADEIDKLLDKVEIKSVEELGSEADKSQETLVEENSSDVLMTIPSAKSLSCNPETMEQLRATVAASSTAEISPEKHDPSIFESSKTDDPDKKNLMDPQAFLPFSVTVKQEVDDEGSEFVFIKQEPGQEDETRTEITSDQAATLTMIMSDPVHTEIKEETVDKGYDNNDIPPPAKKPKPASPDENPLSMDIPGPLIKVEPPDPILEGSYLTPEESGSSGGETNLVISSSYSLSTEGDKETVPDRKRKA